MEMYHGGNILMTLCKNDNLKFYVSIWRTACLQGIVLSSNFAFNVSFYPHAHDCMNFAGKLEKYEIPKRAKICTEQWTPESELVTAAFKLKRKNLSEFYKTDLVSMYNE